MISLLRNKRPFVNNSTLWSVFVDGTALPLRNVVVIRQTVDHRLYYCSLLPSCLTRERLF
jgi:hypothetical protein